MCSLNPAICSIFVIETYPVSEAGKWVTVLMILSGIILIPWQVSRIAKEWIHIATKKKVVCSRYGLRFHDKNASHCKF